MSKPLTDKEAMQLAIKEAYKGWGNVKSNPLVGCVILDKERRLLATGFHKQFGEEHAEINALNQVKDKSLLSEASLFVTLEPCAHEGKTPSCAKALSQLQLTRVVYGLKDPNPLVKGKGLEFLNQAGIKTEKISELNEELEELAEIFLCNMRNKKPFVSIKVATSLDGQMAMNSGESRWITNEQSREYSHYLRAQYDAILIGLGTFKKDNPKLNVRHGQFSGHLNKVILLDPEGESLNEILQSQLLSVRPPENLHVIVSQEAKIENPPKAVKISKSQVDSSGQFNFDSLFCTLYELGIVSIFAEGGAHTLSSLINSGAVDRVYQFVAPIIIGSKNAVNWTKDYGANSLEEGPRLKNVQHKYFAGDLFLTGRLNPKL